MQSTQKTLATGDLLIVRRAGKLADELERDGGSGGEFGGGEAVERISPPSPLLSTAESSIKTLFFLGLDSGTKSWLVKEKKKGEKKRSYSFERSEAKVRPQVEERSEEAGGEGLWPERR